MLSLFATLQTLGFQAKNRLKREEGATAVEYGIMVGLIAVVVIAALLLLGPELSKIFTGVTSDLEGINTTPTTGP